jgi:RND superfamily putative drug exporter
MPETPHIQIILASTRDQRRGEPIARSLADLAASAVFLDAFVVRSLLLPSVLTLLGRRTWGLPSALERRLPRVAIEPALKGPVVPKPAVEEAG